MSNAENNYYYLTSCHLELMKRIFVSIILLVKGLQNSNGSRISRGDRGPNLLFW